RSASTGPGSRACDSYSSRNGCAPGPRGRALQAGGAVITTRVVLLDDDRSRHVRMNIAAEKVGARGERRDDLVDPLRADDLADRDLLGGARVLVDRDVVRRAVLVVEMDRDVLAGGD